MCEPWSTKQNMKFEHLSWISNLSKKTNGQLQINTHTLSQSNTAWTYLILNDDKLEKQTGLIFLKSVFLRRGGEGWGKGQRERGGGGRETDLLRLFKKKRVLSLVLVFCKLRLGFSVFPDAWFAIAASAILWINMMWCYHFCMVGYGDWWCLLRHWCFCVKCTVEKSDIGVVCVKKDLCGHETSITCVHIYIIIITITVIIIAFKGAIQDFLQSTHSATNCLQHARSSGPGAIVCKSRATHRALITCNMSCYVPLGTKGQLSY